MKPLTLPELTGYISKTIPSPRELAELKANEAAGVATFSWHRIHFLVKPTLEVYEIKNSQIFITGSSLLMTRILAGSSRREQTIEVVLETMRQASELLTNSNTSRSGFELLGVVKKTLARLMLTASKKMVKKP